MQKKEIIEFGKVLVQQVRDVAIKSCDVQLHANNMRSPIAKRWRDAKNSGNIDGFGAMVIQDCVDDTIFYLLEAIDHGFLNISLNMPNGEAINLTAEGLGELSGWYAGEWISKYSNERFSNDIS
jgi:hypothetical protein